MSHTVRPEDLPRRIHELPERWVRETPDALAFVDHDGRELTWEVFGAAIDAATRVLSERDVRGGDRVLLITENSVATAAFLFAASRLDAWAVLINARLTAAEVDRIAEHCDPRCAAFTHLASSDAEAHGRRMQASEISDPGFGAVLVTATREAKREPVEADNTGQVAAMIYTSGTTGEPKGVMLTHCNVLYIAIVSGKLRELHRSDRVYAVLPMSHVFGLSSTALGTINAGGTLVAVSRFDPAHLAQALEDGVTVFQGVPAMYARLLEFLEAEGRDLKAPRLRYMSAGGAPLDVDWKRRIEQRFGLALNNGYGLTEASPTVCQTLIEDRRDDDSIGPPIPGIEIRFADSGGDDVQAGEVGELLVRGPNVMKGYYRNKEATDDVITSGGWLRTGDLGRQQADSNCFIVGRAKELIIRSGFNVYPPEVETALNAHEDVVHAAVIGRPVDGNEEVIAFVEAMPGSDLSPSDLEQFARQRLAPYKRPQHLFIVDRLPVNATNKVLKHQLRDIAETLIIENNTD